MHDPKDDRITQTVTNKLATRGFSSPCRLTVQTSNGQVTLSGTVQYAHQKSAATERGQRNDRRAKSHRPNDREASR